MKPSSFHDPLLQLLIPLYQTVAHAPELVPKVPSGADAFQSFPQRLHGVRHLNRSLSGFRVNLLQIRLNGPYSAAFLVNRATIDLKIDEIRPRPAEFSPPIS